MNEVGLVRLPEAEACGYVLYTDGVLKLIHANRRLHELAQRYDLVDGKNLENLLNASQGRYAKGYRAAAERVMESEASDVFAFTENGYGFQLLISIAARNGSGCVFLVQLRENPIPLTLDEVAGIESPGLTSGQDGTVVQTAGKSISTNVRIDHTTEDALDTLRALTNIFVTLVNIDLVNWKLQPIVVAEVSRGFLPEGNLDYDEVMPKFLRIGVDVSYREIMRTFLNREDLVGKLSEHGTLAIDYLGANLGWCRLFLIPSHTDGQGRVTKALFAVREVNAEKAETRRMAYGVNHDPLTGAFNRNGLAMVVDMVHGNTNPMAYAILDLDNFKRFNDTFGHKAGDGLLKRVVRLIIDSFGATDYVARIGGDEFVVVLTNYVEDRDGSVIRKRLAWVNAALADSCEEQLDENPDAPRIEMSLSAGIVLSPKGYRDDFYELADEELYQQKGDGKGGSRVLMLEDALQ